MAIVSVVKCDSYEDAEKALSSCLDQLGGISKFVKPGQKVLLKINQLFGKHSKYAISTHPAIVEAMIKQVRSVGGIPMVGDSPAFQKLEYVAKITGILEVCQRLDVPLVELDTPITMKCDGKIIRSFDISSKLKDFDVIINMPKLKTHVLCAMTLGVKNMFGCIAGKLKSTYHLRFKDSMLFSKMLVDLYDLLKPSLTVLDGVIGMDGQGPSGGEPRQLGLIVASESAYSLDAYITYLAGFKEKEVPTVLLARQYGYPDSNYTLVGYSPKKFKDFKKPKTSFHIVSYLPFKNFFINLLIKKPILIPDKCIRCKRCEEICPAGAIVVDEIGPVFDYNKCIKCYCCHEICPQKAIDLKGGRISNAIDKKLKA